MTPKCWAKRRLRGALAPRIALGLAGVGFIAFTVPLAFAAHAQPLGGAADEWPPSELTQSIDREPTGTAGPMLSPPAPDLHSSTAPPAASVAEPPAGPDERGASAPWASPVSPKSAAIEAALQTFAAKPVAAMGDGNWPRARDGVLAAYRAEDFKPFWVSEDGLNGVALKALATLRHAGDDGLGLGPIDLPADAFRPADLEALAAADVAISAAVVTYAEQASGARLRPARLSAVFDLKPEVADPAEALRRVAAADDASAALQKFNPPQPGYARLKDELARLRAEAQQDEPSALKISSDRTLVATAGNPPALSLDSRREIDAVLANMEMWRWAPRDLGATHVEINIPDFSLRFYRDGELALEERVIVGKPDTPTSIFSNSLKYVILNPAWHVPDSIIKKEFLPKLANDPDYLTRHGFDTRQAGDKLIVVQPPGEANALGRILFMFPNDHAIYLHDTPARGLFTRDYRAFSHGCIRLDQPFTFGENLLRGDARLAGLALQKAIGGGERTLTLAPATPIHIQYFTRFVDDSGILQRRADLYGLERIVARTLARARQD